MGILLARPKAYSNECLMGYLMRLSQLNGFRHIGHLLNFAGLNWKNNRVPVHKILTGEYDLSLHFLRLGVENFLSPASYDYATFQKVIDTPYLFVKYPKVCPECLKQMSYCSYHWAFLPVVACNIHRTLLIDTYRKNGKRLSWYREKLDGKDPQCGSLKMISLNSDSPVLQFNSYIYSLLTKSYFKSDVPSVMKDLSLREALSCINFIAHYMARVKGGHFHPYQMENSYLATIYVEVWKILKQWPDGLYTLLSQFIDNPMSSRGVAGLNKHYRDLYEQLHRRKENRGILLIKEEFDRYIGTYWPGILEKDRLTRIKLPSTANNIISKKSAASILECRPERIDKLVSLKLLSRVIFKGKAHYLRDETEGLAKLQSSNWTMSQACAALQITRYQLKLLLDANVLAAIQKPSKLNRDWVIDRIACEDFIKRLIKKSRTGSVPVESISMAGVLHQGFSVVEVVLLMTNGALGYSYEPDRVHPLSIKQFTNFIFNDLLLFQSKSWIENSALKC